MASSSKKNKKFKNTGVKAGKLFINPTYATTPSTASKAKSSPNGSIFFNFAPKSPVIANSKPVKEGTTYAVYIGGDLVYHPTNKYIGGTAPASTDDYWGDRGDKNPNKSDVGDYYGVLGWQGSLIGTMVYDGGNGRQTITYSMRGIQVVSADKKTVKIVFDYAKYTPKDVNGNSIYIDGRLLQRGSLVDSAGNHIYANVSESNTFTITAYNDTGSNSSVIVWPKPAFDYSTQTSYSNVDIFQALPLNGHYFPSTQTDAAFYNNSVTVPPNFREIKWGDPCDYYPNNVDWIITENGKSTLYPNWRPGAKVGGKILYVPQPGSVQFSYCRDGKPVYYPRFRFNYAAVSKPANWIQSPIAVTLRRYFPETLTTAATNQDFTFYVNRNIQYWDHVPTNPTDNFQVEDIKGITIDVNDYAKTIISTVDDFARTVTTPGTTVIQSHNFGKSVKISSDKTKLIFPSNYSAPSYPYVGSIVIAGKEDATTYSTPKTRTIIINIANPKNQVITFPDPITDKVPQCNKLYKLSATVDSKQPLSYSTSNSGIATIVSSGGSYYLNISALGNFNLYCDQFADNLNYSTASQFIKYTPKVSSQSIRTTNASWKPQLAAVLPSDPPVKISIPYTSFLLDSSNNPTTASNLPLTGVSSNSSVVSLSGDSAGNLYAVPKKAGSAKVTLSQEGTCSVTPDSKDILFTVDPLKQSFRSVNLPGSGYAVPEGTTVRDEDKWILNYSAALPTGSAAVVTSSNISSATVLTNSAILPRSIGTSQIVLSVDATDYSTSATYTGTYTTYPLPTTIVGFKELGLDADGNFTGYLSLKSAYAVNETIRLQTILTSRFNSQVDFSQVTDKDHIPVNHSQTYPRVTAVAGSNISKGKEAYGYVELTPLVPNSNAQVRIDYDGDATAFAAATTYVQSFNITNAIQYFKNGFRNLTDIPAGTVTGLTINQIPTPRYQYPSYSTVNLGVLSGPAYVDAAGFLHVTGTGQIALTASTTGSRFETAIAPGTVTGYVTGVSPQLITGDSSINGLTIYKNVGFNSTRINVPTVSSLGLPLQVGILSGSLNSILATGDGYAYLTPVTNTNLFTGYSDHIYAGGRTIGQEYVSDTTTIVIYNTGSGRYIAPAYKTYVINSPLAPAGTTNNPISLNNSISRPT